MGSRSDDLIVKLPADLDTDWLWFASSLLIKPFDELQDLALQTFYSARPPPFDLGVVRLGFFEQLVSFAGSLVRQMGLGSQAHRLLKRGLLLRLQDRSAPAGSHHQ